MTFLFDAERQLLAEIDLREGALRQIVLTGAGEREVGPFVSLWQTRGIPVSRTVGTADYQEHVQPRDAGFAAALESWANLRGYCVIETPDQVMHLWEGLARLPLEPSERFAFLLAIRLTPQEFLAEWKACLDAAELALSKEREKTRKSIEQIKQQIKQKMEKHIVRPFKV